MNTEKPQPKTAAERLATHWPFERASRELLARVQAEARATTQARRAALQEALL